MSSAGWSGSRSAPDFSRELFSRLLIKSGPCRLSSKLRSSRKPPSTRSRPTCTQVRRPVSKRPLGARKRDREDRLHAARRSANRNWFCLAARGRTRIAGRHSHLAYRSFLGSGRICNFHSGVGSRSAAGTAGNRSRAAASAPGLVGNHRSGNGRWAGAARFHPASILGISGPNSHRPAAPIWRTATCRARFCRARGAGSTIRCRCYSREFSVLDSPWSVDRVFLQPPPARPYVVAVHPK